jgi:hypothetical protein
MEIIDISTIKNISYGSEKHHCIDITNKTIKYLSNNGIISDSKNFHSITTIDPHYGHTKELTFLHEDKIITIKENASRLKKSIVTNDFVNTVTEKISNIEDPIIVITFINSIYYPIFEIFIDYYEKLNLKNLLVISLDKNVYDKLISKNLNTLLINYDETHDGCFWRFRSNIINAVFKIAKKDIVHTDSDCIWLKNILPFMRNADYEIIGQIEHGRPYLISAKYGFVMCCGLFKMTYSSKTIALIDKISAQMFDDDQDALNEYAFNNHIELIHRDPMNIIMKEFKLNDSCRIGVLSDLITTRETLPYTVLCDEDTYCFHPWLFHADISEKKSALLKYLSEGSQRKRNQDKKFILTDIL